MQKQCGTIIDMTRSERKMREMTDEDKIIWLYSLHKKLSEWYNQPWRDAVPAAALGKDYSDGTDVVYDFLKFIEATMATVPATTARMLAIKVEVGRDFLETTPIGASLAADLKRLVADPRQ